MGLATQIEMAIACHSVTNKASLEVIASCEKTQSPMASKVLAQSQELYPRHRKSRIPKLLHYAQQLMYPIRKKIQMLLMAHTDASKEMKTSLDVLYLLQALVS